jgi:RNA recognition motif-containing protein
VFTYNFLTLYTCTDRLAAHAEHSAFVGDVAQTVTDAELLALFQKHYPSCFQARIVSDAATGAPKGYGFVRFADQSERDRALQEMPGVGLHGRPLRVSAAAERQQGATSAPNRGLFSHGVSTVRVGIL